MAFACIVALLLCLLCYTAVWIKNRLKSMSVIKASTKNMMVLCTPVIIWNWSIHFPSLSAMFNLLHSSTNQEVFEKHLCNQGSHYEKYGRFLLCKGSHHQFNTFHCQQRQRRILVSPWRMHWMYCSMPKAPLGLKWC